MGFDDDDAANGDERPDHGNPEGAKPGELAWELGVELSSWSASLQDSEQYAAPSDCTCLSQARQNWCAQRLKAIVAKRGDCVV